MHTMQLRVEKDPLTGRDISAACWNGHHQKGVGPFARKVEAEGGKCCTEEMCQCLCHDRLGAQGDD